MPHTGWTCGRGVGDGGSADRGRRGNGRASAPLVVELSDGETVPADVVVVGIGVAPCTDWLAGSGLSIENGVVCDDRLFAADGVVAAGDVARWLWRHDGEAELIRIEHWEVAAQAGQAAAHGLLAGHAAAHPFTPVPYFWSDQFDIRFQVLGDPRGDDEVEVVHGSLAEGKVRGAVRAGRATPGRDGDRPAAPAHGLPAAARAREQFRRRAGAREQPDAVRAESQSRQPACGMGRPGTHRPSWTRRTAQNCRSVGRSRTRSRCAAPPRRGKMVVQVEGAGKWRKKYGCILPASVLAESESRHAAMLARSAGYETASATYAVARCAAAPTGRGAIRRMCRVAPGCAASAMRRGDGTGNGATVPARKHNVEEIVAILRQMEH